MDGAICVLERTIVVLTDREKSANDDRQSSQK